MNSTDFKLADRILQMEEAATIAMAQKARDLTAQGRAVINLTVGEPDFDTPDPIKTAAKAALDAGYTKYTAIPGLVDLREAIRAKFKQENGLAYGLDQIVVSNGAKQCITNTCLSLLNPGDEVIFLAPYWVSYYGIVQLCGGVPVILSAGVEDDFKVPAERIEAAITAKTRLIVLNSPSNPTGSVYSRAELAAIAAVVARHQNVYIISDEIYEYILFEGEHVSIASFPEVYERTITVNGFSKGFAMTGWRLGYMGAAAEVARACVKVQGLFTSGASAFGQKAAASALAGDRADVQGMRDRYLTRRNLTVKLLRDIPGFTVNIPQGTFFIFPDISPYLGRRHGDQVIRTTEEFCMVLLDTAHVAAVPGSAFGDDRCIRLSFAASEADLREGIGRIKAAVAALSA